MEKRCKMKKKFLRRDVTRFSKFGNGRGKKAKWRKPTGRDNKMRETRKGRPVIVSIGYRTIKKLREKLNEKTPVKIMNLKDLEKIKKNEIGIVGKIGMKKKIEIAKKAKELKIELKNVNVNSFLKKTEKENKKNSQKEKQENKK